MTTEARVFANRKRAAARLAAVQALYELDLTEAPLDAVITAFLKDRWANRVSDTDIAEYDGGHFAEVVRAVRERQGDLDIAVGGVLSDRLQVDRLEVLLRAILRAGAYELSARHDIPASVIINEYLEVAHAFFGGKEPGLVNAVLDRLARSLGRAEGGPAATGTPADRAEPERGVGEEAEADGDQPSPRDEPLGTRER